MEMNQRDRAASSRRVLIPAMPATAAVIMFRLGGANGRDRQRRCDDDEQLRSDSLRLHWPRRRQQIRHDFLTRLSSRALSIYFTRALIELD